jgi:hypothetical protein
MVSIVYLVELNRVRKNRIGRHVLCYKFSFSRQTTTSSSAPDKKMVGQGKEKSSRGGSRTDVNRGRSGIRMRERIKCESGRPKWRAEPTWQKGWDGLAEELPSRKKEGAPSDTGEKEHCWRSISTVVQIHRTACCRGCIFVRRTPCTLHRSLHTHKRGCISVIRRLHEL